MGRFLETNQPGELDILQTWDVYSWDPVNASGIQWPISDMSAKANNGKEKSVSFSKPGLGSMGFLEGSQGPTYVLLAMTY